jgi:hypothetical protein
MRQQDDERCVHCGAHIEAHVYHVGWLVYQCPSPRDTHCYLPRWDVEADDRDTAPQQDAP